jgi:hypothetical protein
MTNSKPEETTCRDIVSDAVRTFEHRSTPGLHYQGWTGASAGLPTVENEWDATVDWRPSFMTLTGLWLRGRYGHPSISQNNMISTTDEVRVTLNYAVKLY